MIKIYPEPARDKIWFEFSEACERESLLTVCDEEGSVMILKKIEKALKGDTFMIDLSTLRPGSYKLLVEMENRKLLQSIIVD